MSTSVNTHADPLTTYAHLTAFQRDIVWSLVELDGEYGLAIKRELESIRDEEVNHGRLYPNLDTLVDGGLITKHQIDKRTNGYQLTETARRMLAQRRAYVTDIGEDDVIE